MAKEVVQYRLLIFGGTGFIGSHLAMRAVKSNLNVSVVSLHIPGENKKIAGVKYIKADISDLSQLKKKLTNRDFEYIINLSGYISHDKFLDGGKEIIKSHFFGLQNILQIINWSKLKHFIQIGSSDEYGGGESPQIESLRESPISAYSCAKVANTHFLQMLAKTENFPVTILRLFLVYGPGQDSERFIPQVIEGCFSGENFATSKGEQLRDFCYIDDITYGILKAMRNNQSNGEVINLASGEPISVRSIIEHVKNYIGKGSPNFGSIPYRVGENMSLYADITKAKMTIGWEPKTTIAIGIKNTVDHYKKNNQ